MNHDKMYHYIIQSFRLDAIEYHRFMHQKKRHLLFIDWLSVTLS